MEAVAEARLSTTPSPSAEVSASKRGHSLRHLLSNFGVAILFFMVLMPHASVHQLHQWLEAGRVDLIFGSIMPQTSGEHGSRVADWIWLAGAMLMGVLSLVRVPPRSATINFSSIFTTAGMMIAPLFMTPESPSRGLIAKSAVGVILIGVIASQVARIYLGRRFGLLPANRGIVSSGPFRIVRHPIYLGWLIMAIGFLMAHPTGRNLTMLLLTVLFMIWRIDLEERLLKQDPDYRSYCDLTTSRVIPLLY